MKTIKSKRINYKRLASDKISQQYSKYDVLRSQLLTLQINKKKNSSGVIVHTTPTTTSTGITTVSCSDDTSSILFNNVQNEQNDSIIISRPRETTSEYFMDSFFTSSLVYLRPIQLKSISDIFYRCIQDYDDSSYTNTTIENLLNINENDERIGPMHNTDGKDIKDAIFNFGEESKVITFHDDDVKPISLITSVKFDMQLPPENTENYDFQSMITIPKMPTINTCCGQRKNQLMNSDIEVGTKTLDEEHNTDVDTYDSYFANMHNTILQSLVSDDESHIIPQSSSIDWLNQEKIFSKDHDQHACIESNRMVVEEFDESIIKLPIVSSSTEFDSRFCREKLRLDLMLPSDHTTKVTRDDDLNTHPFINGNLGLAIAGRITQKVRPRRCVNKDFDNLDLLKPQDADCTVSTILLNHFPNISTNSYSLHPLEDEPAHNDMDDSIKRLSHSSPTEADLPSDDNNSDSHNVKISSIIKLDILSLPSIKRLTYQRSLTDYKNCFVDKHTKNNATVANVLNVCKIMQPLIAGGGIYISYVPDVNALQFQPTSKPKILSQSTMKKCRKFVSNVGYKNPALGHYLTAINYPHSSWCERSSQIEYKPDIPNIISKIKETCLHQTVNDLVNQMFYAGSRKFRNKNGICVYRGFLSEERISDVVIQKRFKSMIQNNTTKKEYSQSSYSRLSSSFAKSVMDSYKNAIIERLISTDYKPRSYIRNMLLGTKRRNLIGYDTIQNERIVSRKRDRNSEELMTLEDMLLSITTSDDNDVDLGHQKPSTSTIAVTFDEYEELQELQAVYLGEHLHLWHKASLLKNEDRNKLFDTKGSDTDLIKMSPTITDLSVDDFHLSTPDIQIETVNDLNHSKASKKKRKKEKKKKKHKKKRKVESHEYLSNEKISGPINVTPLLKQDESPNESNYTIHRTEVANMSGENGIIFQSPRVFDLDNEEMGVCRQTSSLRKERSSISLPTMSVTPPIIGASNSPANLITSLLESNNNLSNIRQIDEASHTTKNENHIFQFIDRHDTTASPIEKFDKHNTKNDPMIFNDVMKLETIPLHHINNDIRDGNLKLQEELIGGHFDGVDSSTFIKTPHMGIEESNEIMLLCSEYFIEHMSASAADLSSGVGSLQNGNSERSIERKIILCDCHLMDEKFVDIELNSNTAIKVLLLSTWDEVHTSNKLPSKEFIRKFVHLASKSAYKTIHLLIVIDTTNFAHHTKDITLLQNALVKQDGCPCDRFGFMYLSPKMVPNAIRNIVSKSCPISNGYSWLQEYTINQEIILRAGFLLSLVPSLSVYSSLYFLYKHKSNVTLGRFLQYLANRDIDETEGKHVMTKTNLQQLSIAIKANFALSGDTRP